MISQTAEYCLRAVFRLAATGNQAQTTAQIALATQIPPGYLCKILQALARARIVNAQRGINGGYVLQRDPASLTLLEIVRIVDTSHRITTCPLGIHGQDLCALHRQLDDAAALAEKALASRTVAQLMAEPGARVLCAKIANEEGASVHSLCGLSGNSACAK